MMRPWRAFIMPRMAALLARKADLRLMCMMSSHSLSFMRISKLSRVMPALFTKMAKAPCSFSMSAIRFSMLPSSPMSSTRPSPPNSASAWLMLSAPVLLVAVPITLAPCSANVWAMAAPKPRVAPVMRAVLPLKS